MATPIVEINHRKERVDFIRGVRLAPGEFFEVVLWNSTKSFTVNGYGFKAESPPRTPEKTDLWKSLLARAEVEEMADDSVIVTIPHRGAFGGYLIEVRSKSGLGVDAFAANDGVDDAKKEAIAKAFDASAEKSRRVARQVLEDNGDIVPLVPLKVFVPIQSRHEAARFGAGFCASWLTDERYKSETVGTEQILRRDSGAESPVRPVAVAFIHIVPTPTWFGAISLGLGVNSNSELAILPGFSARVGEKMFVTAGLHIGAINTKPVGTEVGQVIQDISVLTKPDTRFDSRPFIAFTYSFLGNAQETLSKPFAPPPSVPATP